MKSLQFSRMLTALILIGLVTLSCSRYSDYEGVEFIENLPRDWENPAVFQINREAPRAFFIPFSSETDARDYPSRNHPCCFP